MDNLAARRTPFANYLIPGLILFTLVGVFPLFTAYGLLKRPAWTWPDAINPSKKMHWAWSATWAAGMIMLVWIATETALLGVISFLQPAIAVYGVIVNGLAMLPATRKYCSK